MLEKVLVTVVVALMVTVGVVLAYRGGVTLDKDILVNLHHECGPALAELPGGAEGPPGDAVAAGVEAVLGDLPVGGHGAVLQQHLQGAVGGLEGELDGLDVDSVSLKGQGRGQVQGEAVPDGGPGSGDCQGGEGGPRPACLQGGEADHSDLQQDVFWAPHQPHRLPQGWHREGKIHSSRETVDIF